MTLSRRSLLAGVAAAGFAGAARAGAPQRIVSLNPCLDAILLRVVDPSRIAAVSHYARDAATSTIAAEAADLNFTYETAEEIVALNPDLVLASRHSALATRNALARLGIPFALFGVQEHVEDSIAQIGEVARLCGEPARGEAEMAAVRAALAAAQPPPGHPPVEAVIFQARGFAAGAETLIGELMAGLGFVNVAARYGLTNWGYIPLERLVADPPQLLLSGAVSDGAANWAERIVSHPALKAVAGRMERGSFPEALMYCGGPVLTKTAAALAAARDAYWSRH